MRKKRWGMKSLNFMPLMLPRKGSLDDTGIRQDGECAGANEPPMNDAFSFWSGSPAVGRSLDQRMQILELRRSGHLQPLEQHHFAFDDPRARLPKPLQGDVAAFRGARGDGIGDDEHLIAVDDQVERCLGNANMRLDPGDDGLPPFQIAQVFQTMAQGLIAEAGKMLFLQNRGVCSQFAPQTFDGLP